MFHALLQQRNGSLQSTRLWPPCLPKPQERALKLVEPEPAARVNPIRACLRAGFGEGPELSGRPLWPIPAAFSCMEPAVPALRQGPKAPRRAALWMQKLLAKQSRAASQAVK